MFVRQRQRRQLELAVPVLNEELLRISERRSRLEQSFLYLLQQRTERFQRLQKLLCV